MPKLPRVTGKDVLAALLRAGFQEIRAKGSHHHLVRAGSAKVVTVPVHPGEIVPPKTMKSILEQAELTTEEFLELL
jgi:predicted RNA binding protein YcfA (HicA-like mRNA interferase family)